MEEENKLKILNGASQLFLKYGFKSITMDDIARELGISKKTLYQYYEDKTSLVDASIEEYLNEEKTTCHSLDQKDLNPIDFLLEISRNLSDEKKQINPSIIFDLKKYFKPSWDKLNRFRMDFVSTQIQKNLEKGIAQGLYRNDINVKLITRFYIHLVEFLINPETIKEPNWNFKDMQMEMIKYHLRAICTTKGRSHLDAQLEKLDNT